MQQRLLVLLLCIIAAASFSHAANTEASTDSSLLSSLKYYEVVSVSSASHPLSGPTMHTMNIEGGAASAPPVHPETHSLEFVAHGHSFSVELEKNTALFGPRYSETRQHWVAGVRRRDLEEPLKPLARVEHCYYLGHLADQTGSGSGFGTAAINTCQDGFSGVINLRTTSSSIGEEELIAPLSASGRIAANSMYVIEPAHAHLSAQQLHGHAMRLQALQGGKASPAINVHALHIVYKMHDAMEFDSDARSALKQDPVHRCGVHHPDIPHEHEAALAAAAKAKISNVFTPFSASSSSSRSSSSSSSSSSSLASKFGSAFPDLKVGGRNKATIPAIRYIELFVANDKARYAALGQSTEARSANIANIMSSLYLATPFTPSTLQLVLIGQATFFNQDPWNITLGGCTAASATEVCVDKLLATWNGWRRNPDNTQPYENNDAGHLFSGLDFQSSVLGYAGVGTMCMTSNSGGIEQMNSVTDGFNAAIGAHEVGHNLGMQHDAAETDSTGAVVCPKSGFIMNAIVDPSAAPTVFSPCSKNYYATWANGGSGSCLDNVPTQKYGAAVCGNGYVEEGEQCDCGPYGSGIDSTNVVASFCQGTANPCCDALSCQYIEEAECSNTDACCNNCKVARASDNIVCRPQASSCDLPETCDGTSSLCPFDDNVGNGQSCTVMNGTGACFEGDCVSYKKQCSDIGAYFSGGPFLPCSAQEALNNNLQPAQGYCGQLYCTTAALLAKGGSSVTCTYFELSSSPERMEDGVPCGSDNGAGGRNNDALCYLGECVSPAATNTRYYWATTAWESCSSCDTAQSRNVSCVHSSSGDQAPDIFCSQQGKPASVQQCSDDELLCEHTLGSTITLHLLGTKLLISSPIVMGVSAAFFLILMWILHTCVNYVKLPKEQPFQQQQQPRRASVNNGKARQIQSSSPRPVAIGPRK